MLRSVGHWARHYANIQGHPEAVATITNETRKVLINSNQNSKTSNNVAHAFQIDILKPIHNGIQNVSVCTYMCAALHA